MFDLIHYLEALYIEVVRLVGVRYWLRWNGMVKTLGQIDISFTTPPSEGGYTFHLNLSLNKNNPIQSSLEAHLNIKDLHHP